MADSASIEAFLAAADSNSDEDLDGESQDDESQDADHLGDVGGRSGCQARQAPRAEAPRGEAWRGEAWRGEAATGGEQDALSADASISQSSAVASAAHHALKGRLAALEIQNAKLQAENDVAEKEAADAKLKVILESRWLPLRHCRARHACPAATSCRPSHSEKGHSLARALSLLLSPSLAPSRARSLSLCVCVCVCVCAVARACVCVCVCVFVRVVRC